MLENWGGETSPKVRTPLPSQFMVGRCRQATVEPLTNVDEVVEKYYAQKPLLQRRLYVVLGGLFVGFAFIGIYVPGWPTVSWAVPAAFLFSLSSESMFRWSLTNRYFGAAMFDYYANGKTIPKHAKVGVIGLISLMTISSATFVWYVSTLGEGEYTDPSSWNGADPGFGAATILLVGLIGVWWLWKKVPARE